MKIQESAENYLESIFKLTKRNGQVRSIDIVHDLNFSKPSISFAMKRLRENGYILMDEDGFITLTETGLAIGERTYHRHLMLTEFLMALGVDAENARADACRIEHVISEESFDRIELYTKKLTKG